MLYITCNTHWAQLFFISDCLLELLLVFLLVLTWTKMTVLHNDTTCKNNVNSITTSWALHHHMIRLWDCSVIQHSHPSPPDLIMMLLNHSPQSPIVAWLTCGSLASKSPPLSLVSCMCCVELVPAVLLPSVQPELASPATPTAPCLELNDPFVSSPSPWPSSELSFCPSPASEKK